MSSATRLTEEFASLETYVDTWDLGSFSERFQQRRRVGEDGLKQFYDAVVPLVPRMLEVIRGGQAENADADLRRTLANLILSLAHVALSVEWLGDDEANHARSIQTMNQSEVPAPV